MNNNIIEELKTNGAEYFDDLGIDFNEIISYKEMEKYSKLIPN